MAASSGEVPRLTGNLRIFSSVFEDEDTYLCPPSSALLEKKKEKRKRTGLNSSRTWSDVTSSILKSTNRQDINKVRDSNSSIILWTCAVCFN